MNTVFKNIVSSFNQIRSSIIQNKGKLFRVFLGVLIFAVIFLNSGYTYTYLLEDTFSQTLMLIISTLIVSFIYIFINGQSYITGIIKRKRPTWLLIAFSIFAFSAFLTIFTTNETSSLMMYMSYGLRIFCAFVIARLMNFDKFVKYYQICIFVITLFALIIFIYTLLTGLNYSFFPTFTSLKSTVFYNYFYLAFQYNEHRMQGLFWEPGLFASFLLLALSFEILFRKRIRKVFFITYLVGLILTFSTFGYLCFVLVLVLLVNKKVENFWVAGSLYIILFGGVFVFLAFPNQIVPFLSDLFPEVFSKLQQGGKIILFGGDRLNSIVFDFECWLKSPIFGNGMAKMTQYYAEAAVSKGIHAQTSSLTYFIAEFGILGLAFPVFFVLGLFFSKRLELENKIIYLLFYFLILFKEPHQGIMFDYVFVFLLVKEGLDKDQKSIVFDEFDSKSIVRTITNKDNESIIKRNVLMSFLIKGLSLVLGFFSYPLYMRYFNNENVLGIWLTVLSLMGMIITFDLGLGNGLRNKLVKPLLDNDTNKQNELITSTYISSALMSLLILAIFSILIFTIDINSLLGISTDIISTSTLRICTFVVCASICLEFCLKNVTVILQALQKQALANSFALLSTIGLMLFAATISVQTDEAKLIAISIFYFCIINIPLVIGTIIVWKKYFPEYKARRKDFTKSSVKEVMTLGVGFFVIQLMLLAINSTNELLISNFYGSSTTVIYTDYNKLIQVVISLFATITLPYWSMVTKMKETNDIVGIKNLIKRLMVFVGIFVALLLLIGVFFQPLLDIWLGNKSIVVDFKTLVFFLLYAFFWIISISFSAIANGLSIIKKQLFLYIAAATIKITCSILFGYVFKEHFNWEYIILSNVLACSILAAGLPIICFAEMRKMKEAE